MIYKFIDNQGTFTVENPQKFNVYLPLVDSQGTILSAISPNLSGDIKKDNDRFLTIPTSIEDLRSCPLCRREFFIKTKEEIIRLSRPYNDMAEIGFLYQKINKKTNMFSIEVTNFVPHNVGAEVMWIKIKNHSKKEVTLTPTSFIPLFGRSEKNLRDHRHVSSLLHRINLDKYGIILTPTMIFDEKGHKQNKTNYFTLGFNDNGKAPCGQFPTLDFFYGDGDINSPDAIEKNKKPTKQKLAEFDGKEVCGSLRFANKTLQPGQKTEYFIILGITQTTQDIKNIFNQLNTPEKIKQKFIDTKIYWQNFLATLDFNFNDKNFTGWLKWVKLQPTLRKLFGCSFLPHFDYGKGGRGWRDLWQDALALLITEGSTTKQLIVENFKGIRLDGSNATIITGNGEFIADRNRISRVWMDHGVWPYLTLKLYINRTADLNILLQETTYFRDHQLKRAKAIDKTFTQDDYLLRTTNNTIYQGSIVEHLLVQNLVQFFNVGQHNITRLENADWNDGLDMADKLGESVAFCSMYAHNLNDLCFFLEKLKAKVGHLVLFKELFVLLDRKNNPINYDNPQEKQNLLEKYFSQSENISGEKITISIDDLIYDLKQKSTHLLNWIREKEWLPQGFFNGYYDNLGNRVEGKINSKLQITLTGQVFAIMSGAASDAQIKTTWKTIKKYLYDEKLGGFRLNSDFGSILPNLGRAFGFSYGDKENGAFFSHMVVMFANSLYKRGFIREGFEVLNSIYQMAKANTAKIYPVLPEYFNNQGRGLYLYLTGSASWYIYTLIEEVLGIKFILGDLYIDPKLTNKNFHKDSITIKLNAAGKTLNIELTRKNKNKELYTVCNLLLENNDIPKQTSGYLIKKDTLENLNSSQINIKVFLD